MTHLINPDRARPLLLGALLVAALSGSDRAAAQETIRIPVAGALQDPETLAGLRRRIADAARAHCDSGGVAAIYRSGAERCRERVIAEGERQIQARLAPRLAAR